MVLILSGWMVIRMKHKFSFWDDWIYPVLAKIVGKKYGCCEKLKNCHKCCVKNGWKEW